MKKRIRIIQIAKLILILYLWTWATNVHFSSASVLSASSRVTIICFSFGYSFDWVLVDELEPWLKEWKKHTRNYTIEGHIDQFVKRE